MKTLYNKYKALGSLLILCLFLSSCEKEVDVNLHSVEPRIVIEGIIKQDQPATVRVSQTIDFNNNEGYPNLSGAVVTISDEQGNSEVLQQDSSGWYTAANLKGEIGHTYHLAVTYQGQAYTATSQMPPRVPLDSITIKKVSAIDNPFPVLHFLDPLGETNQYYRALVIINGKQRPDVQEFVETAEFSDGIHIGWPLMVFSTDSDIKPIEKGDELTIELQAIDKATYKFFASLISIGQSPTNPISNISNGALGYFSACAIDRKTIIADWED